MKNYFRARVVLTLGTLSPVATGRARARADNNNLTSRTDRARAKGSAGRAPETRKKNKNIPTRFVPG